MNPVLALACGLLVAGSVHVVKAAAIRPAVTATTGGAANVPVSIAEDIISTIVSILAIVLPIIVGILLVLLVALLLSWWWNRTDRTQTA